MLPFGNLILTFVAKFRKMTQNAPRPYTFDRVVRMLITIATMAAAVWLINTLKDVLLPFLVACLIAYLFEPFVQFNRSLLRLKGRIVAIFITLFEAIVLFGILLYFFVPSIIEEMHNMADMLRTYSNSDISIRYMPGWLHDVLKRNIDFEQLAQRLMDQNLDDIVDNAMNVIHGGLHVVLGIVGWLIVFLYVIFIMLDYDRLMRGFRLMVPPRFRKVAYKIGGDIKTSMNHYFRGQALVALCVGVLFSIGFLIIDMPLAIIFGMFIGLLNMVPYLQLISLIPALILCLVSSVDSGVDFWTIFWQCMAVYCIVQAIQDLFLTPKIMGKAMGLNPAIILLSLSIWGTLLGFLGLIIALPLTTLILAYYDEYLVILQQRRKKRQDNSTGKAKPTKTLR